MPKPPRSEVLPSPNISQAKPTRGPKFLWLPLPSDVAGAKPPGPHTPAIVEKAIADAEVQSYAVPPIVPVVPDSTFAFRTPEIRSPPGPRIKVVALLLSSLCRVKRS